MKINNALSRRHLLGMIGLTAGATLLPGCARGGGEGSGEETSRFVGAYPYPLPPEGTFNQVPGAVNTVLLDSGGIYKDLLMVPGGMFNWDSTEWDLMACENFDLTQNRFTYKLAKGLTWHTGDPITIEDLETTFWCRWVMSQQEWPFVKSLNVEDDQTLVFELNNPSDAVERYIVRSTIVPNASYGDFAKRAREMFQADGAAAGDSDEFSKLAEDLQAWTPENPKKPGDDFLTSGPYRFDFDRLTSAEATLLKQENGFRADQVKFDEVLVYQGETQEITPLVRDKKVDYATHGFPVSSTDQFEKEGYEIIRPATYVGPGLFIAHENVPELDDKLVRQALAFAIDKEQAAKIALGDSAKVPKYFAGISDIQAEEWISEQDLNALEPYKYDQDKAAKLLEQAGWKRAGGAWRTPQGKPAEYTLHFPSDFADWPPAAKSAAEQLSDFGIKVTQHGLENDKLTPKVDKGDFQLAIQSWGGGHPHPHFGMVETFLTNNYPVTRSLGGPGMGFQLEQQTEKYGKVNIQDLITKSGEGLNKEDQASFITELAFIFNELLPLIPIFERYGNNPALPERVAGWPAPDDPILKNSPYQDNFAVMLILSGGLKPA